MRLRVVDPHNLFSRDPEMYRSKEGVLVLFVYLNDRRTEYAWRGVSFEYRPEVAEVFGFWEDENPDHSARVELLGLESVLGTSVTAYFWQDKELVRFVLMNDAQFMSTKPEPLEVERG